MANSKLMTSRTYSGTFPSPETPLSGGDDDGPNVGFHKGWCSERVPRSSYRNRRHVAAAALMPFSSGRTLPSKWEDAERWICSPVSLGNISTNSNYCYYGPGAGVGVGSKTGSQLNQMQRRAKSKSGPLGPIGPGFYGGGSGSSGGYLSFSPVLGMGVINGGRWRNSVTIESSGLASARFEERLGVDGGGVSEGGRRSCPGHATWLDSWSGPPSPTQGKVNMMVENSEGMNNHDEHQDNTNDEPGVDRAISRRDMATQMFPDSQSSSPSSAVSTPISTTSPRPLLFNDPKRDVQSPEYEVRDVQVDKQTSATRSGAYTNDVRDNHSSSSNSIQASNKISKFQKEEAKIDAYTNDVRDNHSSSSNSTEASHKISKFQKEEAKIDAWEALQKAKAEAAIQKLEDKLEKKRESSMEKIIQKLRKAEIKARKMRSSLSSDNDHQTESRTTLKTTSKIPLFCRKIRRNSSDRSCSTCYPF